MPPWCVKLICFFIHFHTSDLHPLWDSNGFKAEWHKQAEKSKNSSDFSQRTHHRIMTANINHIYVVFTGGGDNSNVLIMCSFSSIIYWGNVTAFLALQTEFISPASLWAAGRDDCLSQKSNWQIFLNYFIWNRWQ